MNLNYSDVETYNYNLPEELIAQTPLKTRDNSKLLVLDKNTGKIKHEIFHNIIDCFDEKDVLVLNDTKVLPARLIGIKEETNAKIEVFLLKEINKDIWECLVKPQKRIKLGSIINFNNIIKAECIKLSNDGLTSFKMIYNGIFLECLNKVGVVPLPPYIKKELKNNNRYQTVYAKSLGSSAAPTAGLHFTKKLLKKLKEKDVTIVYVTLHVGLGTFRPVIESDITKHNIHSEYYEISDETAEILNKAKKEGKIITCIGTTSLRTLESNYTKYKKFKGTKEETSIYIYPPYEIKSADQLITNFHLPKSTLIMLVSAFAGRNKILNAYDEAIKNNYRFFSFGDAMFIRNDIFINNLKTHTELLKSYKSEKSYFKNDTIKIYKGENDILLSASHAYKHTRESKQKKNEYNTINIIKILRKLTNCHIIYKYKEDKNDYNFIKKNDYKEIASNYIKNNNIKYFLDFHGLDNESNYNIELGTNNYKNVNMDSDLINNIVEIIKNNLTKKVEVDFRFKAGKRTICNHINTTTSVKSIQIEIKKNLRKLKRRSRNFNKTITTLTKIINLLKEES